MKREEDYGLKTTRINEKRDKSVMCNVKKRVRITDYELRTMY